MFVGEGGGGRDRIDGGRGRGRLGLRVTAVMPTADWDARPRSERRTCVLSAGPRRAPLTDLLSVKIFRLVDHDVQLEEKFNSYEKSYLCTAQKLQIYAASRLLTI